MKVGCRHIVWSIAFLVMLVSSGMNACAQAAPAAPPPTPPPPQVTPADATGMLTQAYAALAAADHDYKGHRVLAMKHIEAAAKELGVTVKGGGNVKQEQLASDQQLRTAQSLLQQAAPALEGKARMHVDKALEQLSIALSIK